MKFDRVRKEEADTVLKLYRSLLGTPYCVWTEDYPTEKEVEFDLSRDALFCMRDEDGNITGVISIDDDPKVSHAGRKPWCRRRKSLGWEYTRNFRTRELPGNFSWA